MQYADLDLEFCRGKNVLQRHLEILSFISNIEKPWSRWAIVGPCFNICSSTESLLKRRAASQYRCTHDTQKREL